MTTLILALVLRLALLTHRYVFPALATDGVCVEYRGECLDRHIEEVTPLWP